ncbi:phosphatase PAP2 family protein [uncultured Helicobacter sp.]|uniref:phosphatase PAP2 family protein n=1 Tax=uncultured Helicobacter sp. TaxID=175537 RepID=UPI0026324FCD|nr:phosphatase PAP2 family protein [uncultured Helicobacter sp.]
MKIDNMNPTKGCTTAPAISRISTTTTRILRFNISSRFCKLALIGTLLCAQTPAQLNAKPGDWFETWGDIFQFLPLMVGVYSLAKQDYEGVAQLALGTGSTLAITFISKYTFVGIAQVNERAAGISQRPNNGSFDGFPSGHTSSAFSAAGFMQKRYGWKYGLPTTLLATSVGISRITSERHTALQVITGALLGYGVSYLFAKRYSNIVLDIDIGTAPIAMRSAGYANTSGATLGYEQIYKASIMYRF